MSMMIGMSESTNASGPENQTAVAHSLSLVWSAFKPMVTSAFKTMVTCGQLSNRWLRAVHVGRRLDENSWSMGTWFDRQITVYL
jgi:hypothetical protein